MVFHPHSSSEWLLASSFYSWGSEKLSSLLKIAYMISGKPGFQIQVCCFLEICALPLTGNFLHGRDSQEDHSKWVRSGCVENDPLALGLRGRVGVALNH